MKFSLRVAALIPWLFLFQAGAQAAPSDSPETLIEFDSKAQQVLFKELTQELRCPKCQNQNIADSNAVVAVDMRNKTLELLKEGKDKDAVLSYMKTRYGDFVHYQPPVNRRTALLWALPALLLSGLLLAMVWRRRRVTESVDSEPSVQAEQQLDALIEKYRRKS